MKKAAAILLLIMSLSAAFEKEIADAYITAQGGACAAAPVDNAFWINPANISRKGKGSFCIESQTGNFLTEDTFEIDARFFSRVTLPAQQAIAAGFSFMHFPYKGDFPGAGSTLWSEMQAVLGWRIDFARRFSAGISGKFMTYDSPAEIHGVTLTRVITGDSAAGFMFFGDDIHLGVSLDNLLSLSPGQMRVVNMGMAHEFNDANAEFPILLSGDLSWTPRISSIDLKLGVSAEIGKRLAMHAGLRAEDFFKSGIVPSLGFSVLFTKQRITYAYSINTRLGGGGSHVLSWNWSEFVREQTADAPVSDNTK